MQKFLLSTAILALSIPAPAATVEFSYNINGDDLLYYGDQLTETVDVAVKLDDAGLVGSKITGLKVNLPLTAAQVNGLSGWLTKELKLTGSKNAPDICSASGKITDQMLEVTFDEPYTITDDVYVGYSFNVTQVNTDQAKYPVAVVYGDNEDGFYYHSSRKTKSWTNLQESLGAVSAMIVYIDGDFGADAVTVSLDDVDLGSKGSDLTVDLINHGTNPVKSIDYSYTLADQKGSGSYSFPEPIPGVFGYYTSISLPIDIEIAPGEYPFSITIDKVNGNVNNDRGKTDSEEADVKLFIPSNRPLVEEFTGLWCGWCPRGYVALETMKKQHGSEFVALAFHNDDPMAITSSYPVRISTFPNAAINRVAGIDPGDIPSRWDRALRSTPDQDINVTAEWADETKSRLVATSTVRFAETPDDLDKYKITYAVVADGLYNDNWTQSNYYYQYAANSGALEGEYADLFLGTTASVTGLTFNDVVIWYPSAEYTGVDNSMPAAVVPGEEYTHSYEIDLSNIMSVQGAKIPFDPDKVRVIAAIMKSTRAINSASSPYIGQSGVETVTGADCELVESVYYDMAGRRVNNPDKGVYIRLDIYSNGTRKAVKVLK